MDCPGDCRQEPGPVECRPCRVPGHTTHVSRNSRITHDWTAHGWGRFEPVLMTGHGPQHFVPTVEDGRGRLVGPEPGFGNLRVAYLRRHTVWADSEIRSVMWGPTSPFNGSNAQQGHLHRVQQTGPGQWAAVAFWTSVVFGGDYRTLHVNAVTWDGDTLSQASGPGGGSSDTDWIDRRVAVTGRERFAFGDRLRITPVDRTLWWDTGDPVTVSGVPGFDQSNEIANHSVGQSATILPHAEEGTVPWEPVGAGATVTPDPASQKRWVPYHLASRVIGGTDQVLGVEWMRWRLGEPQPDWGDPRVRVGTIEANDNVPVLPTGPGSCGLWGAHFYDGSGGEWGALDFQQLPTSPNNDDDEVS